MISDKIISYNYRWLLNKSGAVYCQTPVLGLGLGVDFTFAWDHKNKKNPHLNFLERVRLKSQLANQSSQVKLQLEAAMSTTGVEKSNITPLNSTHLNIHITPLNSI